MKKTFLLFALLWFQQKLFAQTVGNVGIGTYYPNPSAALDIHATNKGVLLPRVFLQSTTDAGAVANPEHGLLIFNTNPGLPDKTGFYFNLGTPDSPSWKNVERNLTLPFIQVETSPVSLFSVENTSTTATAAAIGGFSSTGHAVAGVSSNGTAVFGGSSGTGMGVFASSLNSLALNVNGKMKISGGTMQPGLGKVLTSDGDGNASWQMPINEFDNVFNGFHATGVSGGGNQNMSESTFVKVAFASQKYDIGANYNDINIAPHSSFIAPKNGIYHFDVMIRWERPETDDAFTPTIKLVRIRNGVTTELSENRVLSTDESHTSHIVLDCQLQPSDVINVIARAYGPQVALSMSDRDANFTGHLAIEL
ncbi:hypothetical protein MUK70_14885 [Dyadobacter chenwenxiniae]|uniref:C1q domain-containing protein n=1 Tax=Dyadobacter chenwenxiniae TaxID=2906456 RepID=A0A9X1PG26_9BACT|nr:hypothetical protein [Dyadobacter chenwenxiniae]MCF0060527.1 hypothetical protein [Dyadobacter chenwenxiniae]UON86258.1 hypothetical protein MUK70_14885 [Dyadobacter chenwenxiniae]